MPREALEDGRASHSIQVYNNPGGQDVEKE